MSFDKERVISYFYYHANNQIDVDMHCKHSPWLILIKKCTMVTAYTKTL